MTDHHINDYIVNFLARKGSSDDTRMLKEWLDADPRHREELKQWLKTWDAGEMADNINKYKPDEAYRQFMLRLKGAASVKTVIPKPRKRFLFDNVRRIAAIFAVGFLMGIFSYFLIIQRQPKAVAFVESIVPLGSKSEIKLPDGSTVWLNAGSKLRYPTDYGETTRDIYLEGEGYFKVSKQADKPFTVHTAMVKVKALGTEFNVKAYPEEGVTETTLISGEVSIDKGETDTSMKRTVLLKPGQKLSIGMRQEAEPEKNIELSSDANQLPSEQIIPKIKQLAPSIAEAEVSWKERNWRIESEELQYLTVKMERRYDVCIHVDDALKNYRFTGTIKDESLEQVLNAMQLTAPMSFKVESKDVYIRTDLKRMK